MMKSLFSNCLLRWRRPAAAVDSPPPAAIPSPPGTWPILSARDLLAGRRALVNRIEEAAGTTRPHFERYYLGALWRFAAWAQAFPLPEAGRGHPGGLLLDHGLESARAALLIRQGRLLPPGAPPEESALKQALWTYAVFTLALLGAARSALGLAVTVCGDGGAEWQWNPWGGAVGDHPGARRWRAEFRDARDRRGHPCAGLLLAPHAMDAGGLGLAWLESDPVLFGLWLACACGDAARAGVLAEIVAEAGHGAAGRPEAGAIPQVVPCVDSPPGGPLALPDTLLAGGDGTVPAEVLVAGSAKLPQANPGAEAAGQDCAGAPPADTEPPASRSARPANRTGKAKVGGGNAPVSTPGRECLAWIVSGVQSGRIKCNGPEARVHGVPEGVLLASPGVFQDYAQSAGGADFGKVQESFLKLKLHRRTAAGLNIHRYALSGGDSCVNGILLTNPGAVFGEAAPSPNPLLERL